MKRNSAVPPILFLALLACGLFAPPTNAPAPISLATENPAAFPLPTKEGGASPSPVPTPGIEFGVLAREHLEALTAIGPRVPGSPNEQRAAQYIFETFADLGFAVVMQRFSAWDEDGVEFTSSNVIAYKPSYSQMEIIVGAHYDSGDEGIGADDNASGVAVMLEAAERIAHLETPFSVRFIAFGSEENDLDGSYFYAGTMNQTAVANTLAYVNLDSLAAGDIPYVYSDEGENAFLRDWVLEWAKKNGIPLQTIRNVDLLDEGDYVADYGAFKEKGIPFIYFEATNWNLGDRDGYTQVDPQFGDEGNIWHTPYDTLKYLDSTFPGRVDERLRIFTSALYAILAEFK
jgi:hypothetical protein